MAYSPLNETNVFKRWDDSKVYTDLLTQPFPEFQRIASNQPYPGADPAYPSVTDGTTASIIQKTPKRIVQQIPTGRVIADDGGWISIVADFIYNKKIIPYANEDYGLFEKSQLIIENGLAFGFGVSYAPFLNHDGYFCPDMTLPYWGDIYIQKGKKSGRSCDYIFLRSWYQTEDIDAIIKREQDMAAQAKKRGETYEPTWDTTALQAVKDKLASKDAQALTPSEKERGTNVSGVEFVTAFQKGVGAKFLTFHRASRQIVRTKINKDPRGAMPLDWFYGDVDGTSPLGRSVIELIGPLQNLIDSDMQAYQYNRALALQPPVLKKGNIGNFSFEPNFVIDASNDPNAEIIPLNIDTSALVNYPQLYGLQKSQLLNLVGSPDTSIAADVGNPGFSKTPAGINSQKANISIDDNAIRKSFETWFEAWSETAINLYFAERSGTEEIQLDKETAAKLRELPGFDESILSPDNKIIIDYDTETPALKFRVDPSTTAVADKAAQVQDATGLLDLVMKYPMLNSSFGGPIDTEVLARRIVINSGIDDPEQVAPEPTEAQKQAKEQAKNNPNPFSPMFDKPSIRINYPDLPPAAQVQLLGNAGVQVSIQDVMQGPVADPNMRGVFNPINDPNVSVPGGGPAQQAPLGAPGAQNPLQQDGVNLSPQEIARVQQDPRFAAQAQQVQQPQQAQPPQAGQPQDAQPQAAQSPDDQQLITQMQQLGVPESTISKAIDMLNKGASHHDVISMLTQPQGGQ